MNFHIQHVRYNYTTTMHNVYDNRCNNNKQFQENTIHINEIQLIRSNLCLEN